ncbi:hypothetical protein WL29_23825 [Burkholderia ubonensis]|uniref:Uncharacterized protein n=1 Tax=Burkholderia ubonensis TaxID=101571 RepID=A0A106QDQ7_9BURK|nr:hypothetical protein WL29_23825 [Burkholderia ubonensis]
MHQAEHAIIRSANMMKPGGVIQRVQDSFGGCSKLSGLFDCCRFPVKCSQDRLRRFAVGFACGYTEGPQVPIGNAAIKPKCCRVRKLVCFVEEYRESVR